jgi:DNA-binding MarR family transcriptional regulator
MIAAERVLHRRLRNRLNDAVEGFGVSYAQVEILLMLEERTNKHGGQIAFELGLTRQSVHSLVRNLELGGLVDVLPHDGTARPIAPTDRGRRRLRMAWESLGSTVHAALSKIADDDRRTALEACDVANARSNPSGRPGGSTEREPTF